MSLKESIKLLWRNGGIIKFFCPLQKIDGQWMIMLPYFRWYNETWHFSMRSINRRK